MKKLADILAEISEARGFALRGVGRDGYIRSRGTWLCTIDKDGQCRPNIEAECPEWKGTMHEIKDLIAEVEAKYPGVTKIYIAGGYDKFESFRGFIDGDEYEPWVGAWDVTIWERT